jgi:hypothetical protein
MLPLDVAESSLEAPQRVFEQLCLLAGPGKVVPFLRALLRHPAPRPGPLAPVHVAVLVSQGSRAPYPRLEILGGESLHAPVEAFPVEGELLHRAKIPGLPEILLHVARRFLAP